MTNKEIFRIWAPVGKKWVDWVRPVPFLAMNEQMRGYHFSNFGLPVIDFIDDNYSDAAIIVDLPGTESVTEGIALAKEGWRPIPIYNGTVEQVNARACVDNQAVSVALVWGAEELQKLEISDDAPPAFLTDSNRLNRFKMDDTIFDNSWDVYHQDLPTAEYFLKNGINKLIVIGDSVAKDLKKILFGYQEKKMEIFWTKGYEAPDKIKIRKPRDYGKD